MNSLEKNGRFEDFGWFGGCLEGLESVWSLENKCLGAGNDFIRNLRGILSPRSGGIGKYLLTLECGLLGKEKNRRGQKSLKGVKSVFGISSRLVGAASHLDFIKSYFSDPEIIFLVITRDAFKNSCK